MIMMRNLAILLEMLSVRLNLEVEDRFVMPQG